LDIGSAALNDLVNQQLFDLAEGIIPMPFFSSRFWGYHRIAFVYGSSGKD
jgi:hypothetical protein